MEKEHGTEASRAVATIPKQGQLTQPEAMTILKLVYPNTPNEEIVRCAILCRDFGLHPLMKEVYIIPFKKKWKDKQEKWHEEENWVTVLGINATRKMMSQRGTFSYLDNTPRVMTKEEQESIFGEVDEANIVAITKLRTRKGEEAQGYGRWPKSKEPYGTDKGNNKANMAFIRSERNAFGRLFTDALPPGVEIVDEAYVEIPDVGKIEIGIGEIIEAEATVIEPEEKPEPKPKAKAEKVSPPAAEETVSEAQGDDIPITVDQTLDLTDLMRPKGGMSALGQYAKDKAWKIGKLEDLTFGQYKELKEHFEKA